MSRNVVLLTGRAGSKSVIKKNVYHILGRPLVYYPMEAAKQAAKIDDIFVTTDCPDIKKVAGEFEIQVINRPAALSHDKSELVDAIIHAMEQIGDDLNYLVTMHCNCGVHRAGLVDECISLLDEHSEADSCVTGHIDYSVHPYRTKKITNKGFLEAWMEMPGDTSTNRQNLDPCFILDGAVRVLRVKNCFPPNGQPPFSYLGNKIMYVENIAGGDVHSLQDIQQTEVLLRELGWKEKFKTEE